MRHTFHVSVLTEERTVYEGDIVSLVVPGEAGFFGIWAHHASLVSTLKPGQITLKKNEQDRPLVFHSGAKGFCEVLKNNVTLLLDRVDGN